jgi:outer membrane receptor for ferrienterochelin and colicins
MNPPSTPLRPHFDPNPTLTSSADPTEAACPCALRPLVLACLTLLAAPWWAGAASAQAVVPAAAAASAPTAFAASAASSDAAAPAAVLRKVTVTATLTEQDVRTAPASTTVITAEEMAARNAGDLLEAVRGAPGLTLSPRQVGGRKTLALRGLEGKHTLTLIDGRRISATDDVVGHSDYQYGWLPLAALERIEVIRGPMSALYGSEALGGVINLITRTPTDRWQGSAGLSGSDPTTAGQGGRSGKVSVTAAGPLAEGLGLRVSAEALRSGSTAEEEDPRYSEIEGRRSVGGSAVLSYRFNANHSLEAGLTQADEERFYDSVSGSGTAAKAYRNTYDIDRQQAHLGWRGRWAGGDGQLRTYRSDIEILNSRSNGVAATRPQSMSDRVLDGHAGQRFGDHRVTVGGEWREETLTNAGLTGGQDDATHRALFLQDEWALTDALMLTAGLRNDRHEYFGSETSPRAYLVWQASPQWVVKGGAGHAFKAPTLKQISPSYVGSEGPHTFLGNADVRPESSNSFELGVDGQLGAWQVRATAFQTHVKDLITYRLLSVVGSRRTYQYDNVDAARIRGLETGFTLQASRQLAWSTDLTLLDTEDQSTGSELADRPGTSVSTRLDWRAAAGWSLRLGAEYTGSQTATGGADLPAYTLVNASIGQQWKLPGGQPLHLRAGLDNLTNLRLAEKSADFGWAERGRRLFVNARVDF